MMGPIIAAATIGLINLLLYIDWNYKVARRYGWNVFCSVLHVLFAPLTTLFL
jgi:hypothetical protein